MSEAGEITETGPLGDSRPTEPPEDLRPTEPPEDLRPTEPLEVPRPTELPGSGHSSQSRHVSGESQPKERRRSWLVQYCQSHCFRSKVSTSSPPTAGNATEPKREQPTEQIVDIERVWMLKNKGARFAESLSGEDRWELVKFAEEYWTKESEDSVLND